MNYHIYLARWMAQPPGEEVGPRLEFLEWHLLVQELYELARVAEIMEEEEGRRAKEIRRALLVEEE